MELVVVGYGFVGKAVFNALSKANYTVQIVDPKYNDNTISDYKYADGVVLCLPTPSTIDGTCDLSIITSVLDTIPIHMPVMLKSTVTPDAVKLFKERYPNVSIVFSPEFLRASSAESDFYNQKYMVLGGEDPAGFWQGVFQAALPNCNLFLSCSEEEACLVKYASNSFLALKTSYFNQIYDICLNTGMNFDIVRQLIAHDTRIGGDHSMVPGPDMSRGWGGHCFPKDTSAFIQWANNAGTSASLVEEAVKYNHQIRKNA